MFCRYALSPVALGRVMDFQWYFPLATEGQCISGMRWMLAPLSTAATVGTVAKFTVITARLPCMLLTKYVVR